MVSARARWSWLRGWQASCCRNYREARAFAADKVKEQDLRLSAQVVQHRFWMAHLAAEVRERFVAAQADHERALGALLQVCLQSVGSQVRCPRAALFAQLTACVAAESNGACGRAGRSAGQAGAQQAGDATAKIQGPVFV